VSSFRVRRSLVGLALLLGACGDALPREDEVSGAQTSPAGVVDWDGRQVSLHAPGWTLAFCDGEGPFLCVARGDERIGSVELLRLPVRDHATIADVLGRGGNESEALEAATVEFLEVVSADRTATFGEAYRLRADPAAPAVVLGRPGVRLVAEGRRGEHVLERIVQYRVIDRDTVYLLAATGMDGGGPLGEFATEDLRSFEPVFGAVAAASRVRPLAP
jgi:hypothetical protein